MSTVTLNWTVPTTRADGPPPTPLTPGEVAGADIYDQNSPTPTVPIGSVSGAMNSFTTPTLAVGPHAFTVITRDTSGHSSAPSNVFNATIVATLAPPAAITDLAGVINP